MVLIFFMNTIAKPHVERLSDFELVAQSVDVKTGGNLDDDQNKNQRGLNRILV